MGSSAFAAGGLFFGANSYVSILEAAEKNLVARGVNDVYDVDAWLKLARSREGVVGNTLSQKF